LSEKGNPDIKILNIDDWLYDHFRKLDDHQKEELIKLRNKYENLNDTDKNPFSSNEYDQYLKSEHWQDFSKKLRDKYKQCIICGNKSEHVHHLRYRNIWKENLDDVVVLCVGCHCFIHPSSPMTEKIFRERISTIYKDLTYDQTYIIKSNYDVASVILNCAEKIDGLINRKDMAKLLIGRLTKKILKYGFDHIEEFGCLSSMNKKDIIKHIDELIERGCLQVSSLFFPMIQLTDVGRKRLLKNNIAGNKPHVYILPNI